MDGRWFSVTYAEISYETTWNLWWVLSKGYLKLKRPLISIKQKKKNTVQAVYAVETNSYAFSIPSPKITLMFLKHVLLYIFIDLLFCIVKLM